ncbi:hypothetical protein [Lysobacter silvisoli]|nr:hypothetical protein [Lysobacter silvisoli]
MTHRTPASQPRACGVARFSLSAALALASLSAAAAEPSAESVALARDYVVSARFVDLLDGIVNRFASEANVATDPKDLEMKRRVVRDMSREVMADSLARSLAADTPVAVLRDGVAHAKSDIGRIEFGCLADMAKGPEGYPACLESKTDEDQRSRILAHSQTESGVALMTKVLESDAIVDALNASTRDLVARDPEVAAQLADYCERKPDEGMCGYRAEAAAETGGKSDERR